MSLSKNAIFNLVGSAAPLLVGALTIPYILAGSGVELFGVLTIVWVLIGYFSLFDFGIGRALTQKVSFYRLEKTEDELRSLVVSGLWLIMMIGVFGGGVLYFLGPALGTSWLAITDSLQSDIVSALQVAAFGIPVTTLTAGVKGVLEAYEDFFTVNCLRVVLGISNFGMPAIALYLYGANLTAMVIGLVAARIIIMVVHVAVLIPRINIFIDLKFQNSYIRELLAFGSWMTLSNIISPLMVNFDRFVIAGFVGASVVAYYTVPFEVLIRMLILPAALTAAFFPRIASLIRAAPLEAQRLYRRCLFFVALIMVVICSLCAISSPFWLKVWVGDEFAQASWHLASILSVGIVFNSIAQIPHAASQAAGKVKATALVHLGELFLYVPFLLLAVNNFGLEGAAFVWVMRCLADLICMLFLADTAFREIKQ